MPGATRLPRGAGIRQPRHATGLLDTVPLSVRESLETAVAVENRRTLLLRKWSAPPSVPRPDRRSVAGLVRAIEAAETMQELEALPTRDVVLDENDCRARALEVQLRPAFGDVLGACISRLSAGHRWSWPRRVAPRS
jgi:hypothetical protein